MKNNKLVTEDQVKNMLGIDSFRSISKEKIIEFVSSMPDMDREVAVKCIEQFPEFKESANLMVAHLINACETILKDDKENRETTVETYKMILSNLDDQLHESELSLTEKQDIIDKMIDVADKVADLERDARSFRRHIIDIIGGVASFGIAVGGAILGVKFIKKE